MTPPLHLFYFLFYTDVGAALLLVWAWGLGRSGRHWAAAAAGLAATMFRQTSVIWLGWIAADVLLERALAGRGKKGVSEITVLLRWLRASGWRRIGLGWALPYVSVALSFAAFVVWNGGAIVSCNRVSRVACNAAR